MLQTPLSLQWGARQLLLSRACHPRFNSPPALVLRCNPWGPLGRHFASKSSPKPSQQPVKLTLPPKSKRGDPALEKRFAAGLEDQTEYTVEVYSNPSDGRFAAASGLIGFCLVFMVFWTADKAFSITQSFLLWMGSSESLEPYIMESMGQDTLGVKLLGLTCMSIFAWFVCYVYKQYVGRQVKQLLVVRRNTDIFLRLTIFKPQGAPRVVDFPLKRVTCPQLEEIPLSAVETDRLPNSSFRAYTLKVDGELGFFNEGFWMKRHLVRDKKALWQLFNQDRVAPEHNVWLHFLRAKHLDPTLFPCRA